MDSYNDFHEISEEFVAAWLDSNLSNEDDSTFVELLASDFQLAEILDAYDEIESEFETLIENGYEIPEILDSGFTLPSINLDYFEEDSFELVDYNNPEDPENGLSSDESIELQNETEDSDNYDESIDNMEPTDFGVF